MSGGLFVVFEGGDGAGKSTQVQRCAEALAQAGIRVLCTREPGGTEVGARIRELVLTPSEHHMDERCEALLIAADKAQHVAEVIVPALERGEVVLCDRYVDSMLAYQGAGRVLAVDELSQIATWAVGGVVPDLTIVLDVHPEVAVATKKDKDRMEGAGADFHTRVRQGFLDLAARERGRYLVVDARADRAHITDVVLAEIHRRLTNCQSVEAH